MGCACHPEHVLQCLGPWVWVNGQYSEEFSMGVDVHQGSVLSPLLFILVQEELLHEFLTGVPWELLYDDDLGPFSISYGETQVTWNFYWPFSIFTLSDLEAKSLGEIPSDFGCCLGDILGRSNSIICILYIFKFIYVTLYGITAWKLLLDPVDMRVHEIDTSSASNMLQGC